MKRDEIITIFNDLICGRRDKITYSNGYKLFEDNNEDNFASSLDNQCTDFSSPAHCDTSFFALL